MLRCRSSVSLCLSLRNIRKAATNFLKVRREFSGTAETKDNTDSSERMKLSTTFDLGTFLLPQELVESTKRVLAAQSLSRKEMMQDATALSEFLKHRVCPGLEPRPGQVPKRKGQELDTLVRQQLTDYRSTLSYGDREALAYLTSRQAIVYGATVKVLGELQWRLPNYQPKTILDVGSGVGTGIWAAWQTYGNMDEYLAVDVSLPMLNLAEELLKDENGDSVVPGVIFKPYVPVKSQHDMVLSAYTLLELDQKERKRTILDLWNKTSDLLVLIEMGRPEGFNAILEARDTILNQYEETEANGFDIADDKPRIVAPCPHALECPKAESLQPCHFPVRVMEIPSLRFNPAEKQYGYKQEKYSYIVLQKPSREIFDHYAGWDRIVQSPTQRRGNMVFQVCSADGSVREVVKGKRIGKEEWKGMRKRKWGDVIFPA